MRSAAVAFPPLTPTFILTCFVLTRPAVWQWGQMSLARSSCRPIIRRGNRPEKIIYFSVDIFQQMWDIAPVKMKCRPAIAVRSDAVLRSLALKNMTQGELAQAISTSRGYLSMIITGRRQPGPVIRRRMQKVLGGGFHDLFLISGVKKINATGRNIAS